MTFKQTTSKQSQDHSFGTDRFVIYDFLYAVNSNFCSRTHRLATIHYVTDRQADTTLRQRDC